MCWNGLANCQTWIQLKIYGEYWKNLNEFKIFSNEEWDKILLKCCQNLIETYRYRLKAGTTAKGGQFKYEGFFFKLSKYFFHHQI